MNAVNVSAFVTILNSALASKNTKSCKICKIRKQLVKLTFMGDTILVQVSLSGSVSSVTSSSVTSPKGRGHCCLHLWIL